MFNLKSSAEKSGAPHTLICMLLFFAFLIPKNAISAECMDTWSNNGTDFIFLKNELSPYPETCRTGVAIGYQEAILYGLSDYIIACYNHEVGSSGSIYYKKTENIDSSCQFALLKSTTLSTYLSIHNIPQNNDLYKYTYHSAWLGSDGFKYYGYVVGFPLPAFHPTKDFYNLIKTIHVNSGSSPVNEESIENALLDNKKTILTASLALMFAVGFLVGMIR